jgi:hypothetical protein
MSQKGARKQRKKLNYCRLCYVADVKLTVEDVVPRWLRSQLLQFIVDIQGHPDPQAPPKTILPVCESHNRSMSSLLEDRVAPIFKRMSEGRPLALTPDDQDVLVSWSAKTESLMDLVSLEEFNAGLANNPRGVYNRAETAHRVLSLIQRRGAPEPGWVVAACWIDHLPGGPAHGGVYSESRATTSGHPNVTYIHAMGRIAFITLIGTNGQVADFVETFSRDSRFVILRPRAANAASWPPPQSCTQWDIEEMRVDPAHSPRLGWRRHHTQELRQKARAVKRTVVIGPDVLSMALTADDLGRLRPGRYEPAVKYMDAGDS